MTRGTSAGDDGGTGTAVGRCGGDPVTLAVTASSAEKAQLLKQLAAGYNDEGHAVDGRCVQTDPADERAAEQATTTLGAP